MIYAQHFTQEEFREWSDDMSARLITMLDVLRFKLGSPIEISLSEYALGRNLGRGKMSEAQLQGVDIAPLLTKYSAELREREASRLTMNL